MLLRNRKRRGYLVENVMMGRSRAGCEQYDIPIKMLQRRRMVLVKTQLRRMWMRTGGWECDDGWVTCWVWGTSAAEECQTTMMRMRRMVLIILIVVCWSCRLLELYESIVSCLQKRFEGDGDNRLGMWDSAGSVIPRLGYYCSGPFAIKIWRERLWWCSGI